MKFKDNEELINKIQEIFSEGFLEKEDLLFHLKLIKHIRKLPVKEFEYCLGIIINSVNKIRIEDSKIDNHIKGLVYLKLISNNLNKDTFDKYSAMLEKKFNKSKKNAEKKISDLIKNNKIDVKRSFYRECIKEFLAENFDNKLTKYFPDKTKKWKKKYEKQISNPHDEPWLTLLSVYAIFGDQKHINEQKRLDAVNEVLAKGGLRSLLQFDKIIEIRVEEKLPKIVSYRNVLKDQVYHLYPDRIEIINEKKNKDKASFEGSTNLDLKIVGKQNGTKKVVFIEAKYLSDISYQISYNPVRDQIIRNVDAGINIIDPELKKVEENDNHLNSITNFYFLLLTPKIFRPKEFGDIKKTDLDIFDPRNSRLYCYKMRDYLDPKNLHKCLPHRKLSDTEWDNLSKNMGWITFEDIINEALKFDTFESYEERESIEKFFKVRNLL